MSERSANRLHPPPSLAMDKSALEDLIRALQQAGYEVIGPVVDQGAIMYRPISTANELPIGYLDVQEAATYRLEKTDEHVYFAFTVGPQAWKAHLFPPREEVWRARQENGRVVFQNPPEPPQQPFLGVRGCELAAIRIQDRIFLEGPYEQPTYARRRERTFIVAVNCTRAGETCFCTSMGTGPAAGPGYDLALTELDDVFLVQVGSPRGQELMASVPHREATQAEIEEAHRRVAQAAQTMGRRLDIQGLPELMRESLESPHWEEVAQRCLACANCTLVCPTCFCFTLEDVTDLTGQ